MASQDWANNIKIPQRHRDENSEGLQEKGLLECSKCHNVNYNKSWHAKGDTSDFYKEEADKLPKKQTLCPACKMQMNGLYEGKIKILNIPEHMYIEILRLISSYGDRAYLRDPQDRIIKIIDAADSIEVYTTENQLAVKLAKKIKDTFKKFTLRIVHSKEPYEVEFAELKMA